MGFGYSLPRLWYRTETPFPIPSSSSCAHGYVYLRFYARNPYHDSFDLQYKCKISVLKKLFMMNTLYRVYLSFRMDCNSLSCLNFSSNFVDRYINLLTSSLAVRGLSVMRPEGVKLHKRRPIKSEEFYTEIKN